MKGVELRRRLLEAKPVVRAKLVARLPKDESAFVESDFETFHHDGQLPPEGDWRTWLLMAGRGFGKSRAGAEWVLSIVRGEAQSKPLLFRGGEEPRSGGGPVGLPPGNPLWPVAERSGWKPERSASQAATTPNPSFEKEGLNRLHIALVGATVDEAWKVMVEGDSGLLALAAEGEIAEWSQSQRILRFDNGALATVYSGARGESLRGPEHSHAWCDELAKWTQAENAWNNLQLGLRVGDNPRALVTTTPRKSALLERIRDAPDTVETGGATTANPHLPPAFVSAMVRQYGGTRLGLQEVDGVLLSDVEGSLWPVKLIERCRVSPKGDFTRTVIGVDPPASANGTCGIVVCALDAGGIAYVIADCSVSGASPETWARSVAEAAARFDADRIVAEKNQGGEMVRSVLLAASATLPVELVHAAVGKTARAEPVAALFENGRAFFAGYFGELEAQLGGMVAGGEYQGSGSPDRADACVWALWALLLKPQRAEPRISVL